MLFISSKQFIIRTVHLVFISCLAGFSATGYATVKEETSEVPACTIAMPHQLLNADEEEFIPATSTSYHSYKKAAIQAVKVVAVGTAVTLTGLIVYDTIRLFMLPDCPPTLPKDFLEVVNNSSGNAHRYCVTMASLDTSSEDQGILHQMAPTCMRAVCHMASNAWHAASNFSLIHSKFLASFPPSQVCIYEAQDPEATCRFQYFLAAKQLVFNKVL